MKSMFSIEDRQRIQQAIADAERLTSGEIRVHIESSYTGDILDRSAYIFKKLSMHKTELRNGVLFYLAIKKRNFAVIADVGINAQVPEGTWVEVKSLMEDFFRKDNFTEGWVQGILKAGTLLKTYFPYDAKTDKNELSDEISFGK